MSELISVRQILAEYASNEYSAELLLKHAIEHLKMTQQQAEPQRVTMAHMDALHKAIDHVAALQNNRLRFRSACEISGDKHPEYVRGYEAAMDAVCRARKKQAEPVGVVREFHVDWHDQKPQQGTHLYTYGSLGPSLLEQSDLEFIAARLGRVANRVGYPMPSGDSQFIVSVSGSILGGIASMLDKKQQEQPAPIPTSERLPTEADADCHGRVWVYGLDKDRWIMTHWMNAKRGDYWLPTGLTLPPTPGDSDE